MSWEPPSDMDREVVGLCRAINRCPGLSTESSCSGHGTDPLSIWLEARNVASLYPLARALDVRYGGPGGWACEVQDLDLPHKPVVFHVTSRSRTGEEAYRQADEIAEIIEEFLVRFPSGQLPA